MGVAGSSRSRPTATVHLTGDGLTSTHWVWEWDDGGIGYAELDPLARDSAMALLNAALPGECPPPPHRCADLVPLASPLLRRSRSPHTVCSVHRSLTGAMASSSREADVAESLRRALLPRRFADEVLARSRRNRIVLRIAPPPALASVPWEIVAIHASGARLIDVVDLETAPPIGIGGGRDDSHKGCSRGGDPGQGLYVIDPLLGGRGQVLSAAQAQYWATASLTGRRSVQQRVGRLWLSNALRSRGFRRLLFIGHVGGHDVSPGSTSLLLHDPASTEGLAPIDLVSKTKPLCANDLVEGTQRERGAREADWRGLEAMRPGSYLWPMPQRVGVIGCGSGLDLAHVEPFGLVTAMIASGARIVSATQWALPTDFSTSTYSRDGVCAPVNELARAVDQAHQDADPVAFLANWQRRKLGAWRRWGELRDSPLFWASITTYRVGDWT